MGKLKDQLAGIAALIAAIVAIGGGFVKYGEITTKLEALEGASKMIRRKTYQYNVKVAMRTSSVYYFCLKYCFTHYCDSGLDVDTLISSI